MSQPRPVYANPRRQIPRDHMPAQLGEDNLNREVDRRRDRDFRDREVDNRRSQDDLDRDRDGNYRRTESTNDERFVPEPPSGEKKNYIKPSRRNPSTDSYDDRRRDDRGYDDRHRDDRGYDDRDRHRDDRGYDDRRYDDRRRDDRGYDDDRRRDDRYYDDRDRRPPYDDRHRQESYEDRRYDERDNRRDNHVEEDRFIDSQAQPTMTSVPSAPRASKPKRYMPPYHNRIALICSVVVSIAAFFYIGLGVTTAVLRYYNESAIPFIAAVVCIVQAVFGCHSARRQSYNFMYTLSSVAVVCTVTLWGVFGFFAYFAGRFLSGGYQYQHQRPDLGYVAVAGVVLTFFCLVAAMAQMWIACGVTCCAEAPRPKETKAHHAKQAQSEV